MSDSLRHRRAQLEHRVREGFLVAGFKDRLSSGEVLHLPRPRDPQPSDPAWGDDDMSMPNGGRAGGMYAHWLGEDRSAFETDRIWAAEVARRHEMTVEVVKENRRFVLRAARFAAEQGIRQFVDIGAAAILQPSVAKVVREVPGAASSRVVYVDNDPAVTAQTLAMDARGPGVTAITGDLRDPIGVMGHPELLRAPINRQEPVCLLLAFVLHFVSPDEAREALIGTQETAGFYDLIAPGSLVVISVGTVGEDVVAELAKLGIKGYSHARGHVAAYFDGLEMLEPGMVAPRDWRPDGEVHYAYPSPALAGVGRKLAP